GRHLDRDLVGLELDQRFVDRDGIARLLEPLADRRLGHRFAERRNADVGHVLILFPSCPALCRASTSLRICNAQDVDGRAWVEWNDAVLRTAMPGHDDLFLTPAPLRGIA